MTTSPVDLLASVQGITGHFLQAFVFLSRSTQVKAVITVHCHVKGDENN